MTMVEFSGDGQLLMLGGVVVDIMLDSRSLVRCDILSSMKNVIESHKLSQYTL